MTSPVQSTTARLLQCLVGLQHERPSEPSESAPDDLVSRTDATDTETDSPPRAAPCALVQTTAVRTHDWQQHPWSRRWSYHRLPTLLNAGTHQGDWKGLARTGPRHRQISLPDWYVTPFASQNQQVSRPMPLPSFARFSFIGSCHS